MSADHGTQLAAFLTSKRWFGDKTRQIRRATLRDRIPVSWPNANTDFVVARADVDTDAGRSTYQLFLGPEAGNFADALENEQFRRGLVDAFARGARIDNGETRWIVESEGRHPMVVPPGAAIRLSTAEQSNSSLVVDGQAILKLFRRLEPGVHPDLEVTRFLTIERHFVHVPVLLGTIRFEDADGVTIAGMLQELVPGAMDGWSFALRRTRDFFAARREASIPFQDEARELGTITRALHETLASGEAGTAFAATPATAADVDAWTRAVERMAHQALDSLRGALDAGAIPRAHVEQALAVADSRGRLTELVGRWRAGLASDAGLKTRTHGDYHLGQVLRSAANRFLVIDFEGEPARPLAERRALQSPLRDVAGMLRSFAYLGAVAASEAHASDDRARRWERAARDAFLQGYFATRDAARALLPRERDNAERLIALFEVEKAFYELQYELDHRPDWVWIPLHGITALAA